MGWENKYLSIILYLDDMIRASTRDERLENAKIQLGRNLDFRVKAEQVAENINPLEFGKGKFKEINLSDINLKDVKRKIQTSPYKNIEIQELRLFIEEKLEQLLKENTTRISFSERYKAIIDRYNAETPPMKIIMKN